MDVPKLPMPDDLVRYALVTIFGSGTVILVIFYVANFVLSWWGAAKAGTSLASGSWRVAIDASTKLMRMRVPAIILGLVISVLMLAIQAIWLGVTYVMANWLWLFFVGRPGVPAEPDWCSYTRTLHWDWFSQLYLALAVLTLLVEYVSAFRHGRREGSSPLAFILTAPVMLIGLVCAFGAVLAGIVYVMYEISDDYDPSVKNYGLKTLSIFAIAIVYVWSTYTICKTPFLIAKVWSPRGYA